MNIPDRELSELILKLKDLKSNEKRFELLDEHFKFPKIHKERIEELNSKILDFKSSEEFGEDEFGLDISIPKNPILEGTKNTLLIKNISDTPFYSRALILRAKRSTKVVDWLDKKRSLVIQLHNYFCTEKISSKDKLLLKLNRISEDLYSRRTYEHSLLGLILEALDPFAVQ